MLLPTISSDLSPPFTASGGVPLNGIANEHDHGPDQEAEEHHPVEGDDGAGQDDGGQVAILKENDKRFTIAKFFVEYPSANNF